MKNPKRELEWKERLKPLIHQPLQTYRGGAGAYITEGTTKIQLSKNKHQVITEAGRVYWGLLDVPPPLEYDYNQPLEQDKFVRSRTGKRIAVRKRQPDGSYAVLKRGEAYFRYHKVLWIPSIPRLIIKVDESKVVRPNPASYVSLNGLPHLTTATLRETGEGVTTDEEY